MSTFIHANDIGDAWLQAYRELIKAPGRHIVNLAVSIDEPLHEDLGVRGALENTLAGLATRTRNASWHSVHTVANTIFPISLYRPGRPDAAQRFFERAGQVSRLHHKRKHEWGTYIGRLLQYEGHDGKEINQLEQFLALLNGDTNWADGYEAPLTYPGEVSSAGDGQCEDLESETATSDLLLMGPNDRRRRGGPCLAHVSLTSVDGSLHLTALYRRHHYLARAYGNFLGLARLLNFLAYESGRKVGKMLVVGTHAEIEPGPHREDLTMLLNSATVAKATSARLRSVPGRSAPAGGIWICRPPPHQRRDHDAMTAQDTNSAALGIGQSHIEGSALTERAGRLLARLLGSTSESLRVGIDACDVAKLRRQLRLPSATRFLANSFTEQELDYCAGQAERIAARWAAKEAVAKAIGSGFRGLQPAQIEICRHLNGAPYVQPVGNQPWPLDAHIWSWSVSLGHEGDLAVAAAIALPTITVMTEPAHADTKRSLG